MKARRERSSQEVRAARKRCVGRRAAMGYARRVSEALHEELKPHGIHVSALCPGPTATEFAAVAGLGDAPLFRLFGAPILQPEGLKIRPPIEAIAAARATHRLELIGGVPPPKGVLRDPDILGRLGKG